MRFPVTPSRVKAVLKVGRDCLKAELLDESVAGFAVAVEVPRRRLGESGFTSESECDLFGEIGRLEIVGHSDYEVQIISIVPREDQSASTTRSRVALRLGTRVVREIYQEDRNSLARNLRLSAAIVLAMAVSLYCTAKSLSGQVGTLVPSVELSMGQLGQWWNLPDSPQRNWKHEIAYASQRGYIVPESTQMRQLLDFAQKQPPLQRVERVFLLQKEAPLLEQMKLDSEQLLAVRQIALETQAEIEWLWNQLQDETHLFQQRLGQLLTEVETRILAHLSLPQARIWLGCPPL